MKNYKEIPIPDLMLELQKDPRGLPVPYVVLKDNNGKHHFKVNDTKKQLKCLIHNLCSICGKPLEKDIWLVGGIASAFDEYGGYVDTPVHEQCGHYALQVCPYLAYSGYDGKIDLDKMSKQLPGVHLYNPTVDPDRLPFFVFLKTTGILISHTNVKPISPYLKIEYWNNGEQITDLTYLKSLLDNTKWEKYQKLIV